MGYDQTKDRRYREMYDKDTDMLRKQMDGWYESMAKPMLDEHHELVISYYRAYQDDHSDALLATCDEGTKCREKRNTEFRAEIEKAW